MPGCLSCIFSIDQYLVNYLLVYGGWAYGLLFLVVFCETGLVVTPFLPGDSLLFIAGSLAGHATHTLRIEYLLLLLVLASFLGNQLNYSIGRFFGARVLDQQDRWWCRQHYLKEAHQFYEKHGEMTLIFARFIPIIRTFVPFVAGVAAMCLSRFTTYNLISAGIWIGSMLFAGYFLGQLPFVQAHLSALVYGIILISLAPSLLLAIRRLISGATCTDVTCNE